MKPLLTGLVAAPYTPFKANGDLALDVIRKQVKLLTGNGVRGAFICGTTGEGSSLTCEERRKVAEAWMANKPEKLAVIVHVGHGSARESQALAIHAKQCGATAIASIAPSYFRPSSVVELVDWCASVAAAAPDLPFYYYHMPAMTGLNISATAFLERADRRIPTLVGIKFTHENLMDFSQAARFGGGRYELVFGRDEILLAGLTLGAKGAVGSMYNFAAPLFNRIIRAHADGQSAVALRLQTKAMDIIDVLIRHGAHPAGKATMKLIGLDCGPTRLPLPQLTPAGERSLRAELKEIGFFDFASKV
jgi:N-acetylneuraminate lyase